jgi:replicative DNA helicase
MAHAEGNIDVPTFYDHELELRLIGCALMGDVAPVSAAAFHHEGYRRAWRAICDLARRGKPITLETLAEFVPPDVLSLADMTRAVANASVAATDIYAEKLMDLAQRRTVLQAAQRLVKDLSGGKPADELIAAFTDAAVRSLPGTRGAEPVDPGRLVEWHRERMAHPGEVWGIRTGMSTFDEKLGGLHPGTVTLIAGEPGVGKSTFVCQLAFQMAGLRFWDGQLEVDHVPGAIYSLEMAAETVMWRVAIALARIDGQRQLQGRLTDDENRRYEEALGQIHSTEVFISDRKDWTTAALRADVARLVKQRGIKWVVIDYAGLLKDPAPSRLEQEIKISQGLAQIAKLGVAVIAVETLNKTGLRGDDTMAGVRGSVQKVYDADMVAYLYTLDNKKDGADTLSWPGANNKAPEIKHLRFVKVREGQVGVYGEYYHYGAQRRFEPAPRAESKG